MGGVAGDEHGSILEAIGDQPAADPVLLGDDFEIEIGPDAKNLADRPGAVYRIVVRLVVVEKIVDEPGFLPVDRNHGAAAARVEREIHPAWLARQQVA